MNVWLSDSLRLELPHGASLAALSACFSSNACKDSCKAGNCRGCFLGKLLYLYVVVIQFLGRAPIVALAVVPKNMRCEVMQSNSQLTRLVLVRLYAALKALHDVATYNLCSLQFFMYLLRIFKFWHQIFLGVWEISPFVNFEVEFKFPRALYCCWVVLCNQRSQLDVVSGVPQRGLKLHLAPWLLMFLTSFDDSHVFKVSCCSSLQLRTYGNACKYHMQALFLSANQSWLQHRAECSLPSLSLPSHS